MIPKIEAFKEHNAVLNSFDMIHLPSDTPYGNLTLKWSDVMQRFDNINDKIEEIYKYHSIFVQNRKENIEKKTPVDVALLRAIHITRILAKHRNLIEELIYWLRKSTDEMISLVYILDYFSTYKVYPEKIEVESIGKLLKEKSLCVDFFSSYYDVFKTINDVSNAYKHSFMNTEISNHIGNNEPYFFALSLSNNNLKKTPNFYYVGLTYFLIAYGGFCTSYKQLIQKYNDELTSSNSVR